ncbi:inositol 1,4,5-triphosphate receptor associated 2-like [Sycon ciliatum]|uniref:inositol 1,4,5-triphosphate receptor associated 2-like n=1 Tax=Sycon ciliatum TaxID=27933 RepID=UPI0031F69745
MSLDSPEPTEQEILASVFYHCDTQKTGLVAVSQILEFLRRTKPDWDFGELQALLDPNGEDPVVDIDAYQHGISQWVQAVRSIVSESEGDATDGQSSSYVESEFSQNEGSVASLAAGIATDNLSIGSSVLEGNSCDLSRSWDLADAMTALQEARQQIKHLCAENESFQQALATAEEQNTGLITEVEGLRKRVSKQDAMLSRKYEEDRELEALAEDQRHFQVTSDRVSQLEKEKAQLEMSLTHSEDERLELVSQLDSIQDEYKSAVGALNSNPLPLQQQLHASLEHSSNLESYVKELSSANHALRSDKRHLESLLVDMRDQEVQLSASYGSPLTHSTPMRRADTLHDELMASETESSGGSGGNLKSSLTFPESASASSSAAELHPDTTPNVNGSGGDWRSTRIGSDTDQLTVTGGTATANSSTQSLGRNSSTTEELRAVLSNVRQHFQAKKSLALKQLADLSDSDSQLDEVIIESSVDMNMNSFSNFETKLARLVSSRKSALDKVSKLEKSNALLASEVSDLKEARERLEQQLSSAEERVTSVVSSLEDVCSERDTFAVDVTELRNRLATVDTELERTSEELEDLQKRNLLTCRECGRIITIDETEQAMSSSLSSVDTAGGSPSSAADGDSRQSTPTRSTGTSPSSVVIVETPPSGGSSGMLLSETDHQAIAALLKGLPSEPNLLRAEPSAVEQHYFNISEILHDLCESAEGCPETMRRAKEDAETRTEWCIRQFVALSTEAEERSLPVDPKSSDLLVTQLKCAVQLARLAGRSEQDFVYLTLIKVLVQYINLIRLEVFLPSTDRSPPLIRPDSTGQMVLTPTSSSMPRNSFSKWSSQCDDDTHRGEGPWENIERLSRTSSRSSQFKSITSVFHEAGISHQKFGDVFPHRTVASSTPTTSEDIDDSDIRRCTEVMESIDKRMKASDVKSTWLRSLPHFLLRVLFVIILIFVLFVFVFISSASSPQDVRRPSTFWSLLPLEQLGAQFSLSSRPVT